MKAIVIVAFLCAASPLWADTVVPSDDVVTGASHARRHRHRARSLVFYSPAKQAELLGSVPNWHRVKLPSGRMGFVSKRWTRVVTSVTPSFDTSFAVDVADVGTGLTVMVRSADFTLVYDAGSNDDVARDTGKRFLSFIQPRRQRPPHSITSC